MFREEGLEEVSAAIMREPEKFNALLPRMFDAAAQVMTGALHSSITVYGAVNTGLLQSSIGVYKTVLGGLRPAVIVGFVGSHKRIGNMPLASILNFGIQNGRRGSREARPFVTSAQSGAQESVIAAMQTVWEAASEE